MVGTFSWLDANAEQGEVTAAALIPNGFPLHFTMFYKVFPILLPFKMRSPVCMNSHWFSQGFVRVPRVQSPFLLLDEVCFYDFPYVFVRYFARPDLLNCGFTRFPNVFAHFEEKSAPARLK